MLTTMGSFFGYMAIDLGVEHIVDFFNRYDTDPTIGGNLELETGNDPEEEIAIKRRYNNIVFLYDVGNHLVVSSFYVSLAGIASNSFFKVALDAITA